MNLFKVPITVPLRKPYKQVLAVKPVKCESGHALCRVPYMHVPSVFIKYPQTNI